jgi:Leucine-rich repeat (LRR) protein
MHFIVKTTPKELQRARKWWDDLEMQWKMAYNEAVFGVGPTLEPPADDPLMMLLVGVDTLRLAGPMAFNPNVSTPLTNLSGLVPLYNLKYLSLTHMKVTEVKLLKHFTKLEHLFIQENQIQSLEGIEPLIQLKELYAQHNQITDLKPISKLTNLETLYISNNQLTSLEGITPAHEEKLRKCYALPNEQIRDREILRVQNEVGIICRRG